MNTDRVKGKAREIFDEAKKEVGEATNPIKKNPKKFLAIVAYFLFFIPLFTKDKKDPFVWYHTKQGLGLFLTAMILRGVIAILFGYDASGLIILANLALIVLLIIGVMNASSNKTKPLPVIGKYSDRIF